MTKQTIGKGGEFGGLCIFEPRIPTIITCPSMSSPFKEHCQLGHLSISVLKSLHPQFQHLSSLDCESC